MKGVNFKPDEAKKTPSIPYFEDLTGEAGFRGYSTQKSIQTLQSEVSQAIARLEGYLIDVQTGSFQDEKLHKRAGFVFIFTIPAPGGKGTVMAEISVAAFPVRNWTAKKEEQSKKMVLYVLRDWLESVWNFQRVTPQPVATLIPFMLGNDGETLSDAWISGRITGGLLMSGEEAPHKNKDLEEVVEGEAKEV